MNPIVLTANQAPKFYRGGEAIAEFRGFSAEPSATQTGPEDWLASTVCLFGTDDGLTTLPDGRRLRDAIADDPIGFLGEQHHRAYGTDPALLVKLLDAGQRLPVHVHPDREFAANHLGAIHGKTEAWIVLATRTPDASVYLGFREPVDETTLSSWLETQESAAMLAALNEIRVEPGDTVLVPAGTPHAIGEGVFLVELQEPTDFSIMLEWAAFGLSDCAHEQLGLPTSVALSCLDRTRWDDGRLAAHVRRHVMRSDAGTTNLLPASADPFFRAEHIVIESTADSAAQYAVLVITAGAAQLETDDATIDVHRGDTLLVPYGAGNVRITGSVSMVRCLPPSTPAV
ncbi:MAG: class I mannose-6-phosphate isomerase [Acidothermaceae bacterium]